MATVLHAAVGADMPLPVLDALRRQTGEDWPSMLSRIDLEGRTALHVAAEHSSDPNVL
ncbi:hypothetical protein [Mesobaculum littorinae]|uniref:hypothetical protein n=1 Tax=Mesobaculum littorinae TaxID=2486419 RepID=UPI0013E32814|nr:hypothetical protein [Mesobaculum littorinae]